MDWPAADKTFPDVRLEWDRRITERRSRKLFQLLNHLKLFIEQEVKHDNLGATFKITAEVQRNSGLKLQIHYDTDTMW